MTTHAVSFDAYRHGRKSMAECGEYVDERDISDNPTCPDCLAELAKSATDKFGTDADIAAYGPTVAPIHGDPLRDYKPRIR